MSDIQLTGRSQGQETMQHLRTTTLQNPCDNIFLH